MSKGMKPFSSLETLGESLLCGRRELTLLSAMGPGQSDAVLKATIKAARAGGARLTLCFADLTAKAAFLDDACKEDVETGRLRLVALAGSIARGWDRHIETLPNALWDLDRLIGSGALPVDVVALRAWRTADASQYSYGPMIGYSASALKTGATLAVELVGERSHPAPPASTAIPSARVDHVVEGVWAAPQAAPDAAAPDDLGRNVVALLPGEATLQFGLGSVADSVVAALPQTGRFHVRSGVVTPRLLARHGRALCTTQRIEATGLIGGAYTALHAATLLLRPVSETHDMRRLASIPRFWAINSAIEVDLEGNVNAEFIGATRIALGGGQGDFVRAAHLSDGGASVIALMSRTGRGQRRIVPRLDPANPPTTPAQDVDFVVTDQGAADLRGLTRAQRRRAMIRIAHPDDRDTLAREAGL